MLDELHGEELQMYKRLDRFLHLSWTYAPFWRAVKGLLVTSPALILAFWMIGLIFKDKEMDAVGAGILIVMACVCFTICAFGIIAFLKIGVTDFEHIKALIRADGIGTIHNDLMTVQKLKGTRLHAGSRYLFGKGQNFCRISDISGVVNTRDGGRGGDGVYTATLTFKDECGSGILKIRQLYGMTENARERELEKIRETICSITGDLDHEAAQMFHPMT